MERQYARAAVHDPYPLNDIGPEVVGGRPRGFMNPLPEAKRNRITGPTSAPASEFPPGLHFPSSCGLCVSRVRVVIEAVAVMMAG